MANDSSLWENLKQGDLKSFELVFKVHYPQLCLFANKYTNDFDLAREVVQDMFVYFWEHKDKFQKVKSIRSYFHAAIKFNSIRRAKDQNLKIVLDNIPENLLINDFKDEIELSELKEAIYNCIESLPKQSRTIFKLSRFDSLSYKKISEKLNISPKTVEAHISKALKALHETIDEYFLAVILFFSTFF